MSTEAKQARDDAIDTVEQHAHLDWLWWAKRHLWLMCRDHAFFTSEDIVRLMRELHPEYRTHEPRAWGAILRHGKRERWCEPTERFVNSGSKRNHMRPMRQWKSLIHQEMKR